MYKHCATLYESPGRLVGELNPVDTGGQLYVSFLMCLKHFRRRTVGNSGQGWEETWVSRLTFGPIQAVSLEGTSYSQIFASEMQKSELLSLVTAVQGLARGQPGPVDRTGAGCVCQLPSCGNRPAGGYTTRAGKSGGAGEGCVNMPEEARLFHLGGWPSGHSILNHFHPGANDSSLLQRQGPEANQNSSAPKHLAVFLPGSVKRLSAQPNTRP